MLVHALVFAEFDVVVFIGILFNHYEISTLSIKKTGHIYQKGVCTYPSLTFCKRAQNDKNSLGFIGRTVCHIQKIQ